MSPVSEQQRRYLDAMGIDVWVRRDQALPAEVAPLPESAPEPASAEGRPDVSELDWSALRQQVAGCQLCELHTSRTRTVFGVGDEQARWLIIGEAPGVDEDRQGEPFVGRAGMLLNAMLQAVGLAREQVYIANILKCRPPNNRDPRPEEAAACFPYLRRQIELIQPDLIIALGRVAAQRLLDCTTSLARLRGTVHRLEATGTPVVVTYHPAYLLRTPADKRKAWEDLLFAQSLTRDDQA
ncbi:uracil-DNA glycosylase [Thiohalophilus thiocyanatoxydans]|uniref:Type-4 uracil-DNA glycosylase n=1 Tax=Thiohalophilus thiocyanatoxydans TaxID=381308 RepID=A0A4R8IV54_9GAMM|nr:uracil-DNA glycosylase [Thiohalophilus thiocyanatoxydans]TDY01627.1 DNA polymerase [Thiohalophilus thiocyanatoxydans]